MKQGLRAAVLVLLSLGATSVHAGSLSSQASAEWRARLSRVCRETTARARVDLSDGVQRAFCSCVAKEHLKLASASPLAHAVAQLAFVEQLYSDASPREIKDDPFVVIDDDIDIANRCLARAEQKKRVR